MGDKLKDKINARFQYYPPKPERVQDFGTIRDKAKDLALVIADLCPESREQSVALTHLDEVVFWANAAIAREGKGC